MAPLATAQEAFPVYLPIEDFGKFGRENASSAPALTQAETTQFERAVAASEQFPAYLYSGCHDRAHAAYLMLPAALRPQVKKIWVVGPSRYTAAISGTIGLRAPDAASQAVKWGYHVALAVETPSGMRLFDPALRPGATITRDEWFALMKLPRLSIWTVTKGDLYLFNYATLNMDAKNGNQVWNGNANYYELYAPKDRIIPDNLARDAVGVDALKGETCSAIRAQMTDPEALLKLLRGGAASAPANCASSIKKFEAEKERWTARLH
ncbi:protein-glutamine glutaminase family protein [Archangium violaceum]|uniref:protein-glutamine glutaminase family protein n=1 Tax=Archangium violaceum TaxID=83451 RepID=UPI002B300829|nr:protein-glutamine glutaminase family protein [Archangium gephyra]